MTFYKNFILEMNILSLPGHKMGTKKDTDYF
jgi:hypothetical protein